MSDLPEEAKLILRAAVSKSNPSGMVMRLHNLDGVTIKTRREKLISGEGRNIAAWDSALEKLVEQGLLKKVNEQMFGVTQKGYYAGNAF